MIQSPKSKSYFFWKNKNNLFCYYIMPSKCGGIKTLKLKLKRKRKRKSTGKKKSQKGGAYGNTMNSLSNNAQGGM